MYSINVDPKALRKALNTLSKAYSRRSSLPILEYVLIAPDLATQKVTLTVCDLSGSGQWTRITLPANFTSNGQGHPDVCVHLAALRDGIKGMKSPFLTITETPAGYTAATSDMQATYLYVKIPTLPAGEFPPFPDPTHTLPDGQPLDLVEFFPVEADFSRAVGMVLPNVSTDDARPTLTYVHISYTGEDVYAEASEGHTFARASFDMSAAHIRNPRGWLIARKAAALIAERTGTAEVAYIRREDNHVFYYRDGELEIAAYAEGGINYPDMNEIVKMNDNQIKHSHTCRVDFSPAEWIPSMTGAVTACKHAETAQVVRLAIIADLPTIHTPQGSLTNTLPATTRDKDAEPIAFNPDYLNRLLAVLPPAETVSMIWHAPTHPFRLSAPLSNYLALAMPVLWDERW